MASSPDLIRYICEQASEAGAITSKRMFGEFGLYCDGLLFGVVCNDQLFIKMTPPVCERWPDLPQAPPYNGSRPYLLVEGIDDREELSALIRATCDALPPPAPKKPRKPKQANS